MAPAPFNKDVEQEQRDWIRFQMLQGARPEPKQLVTEWAEENRILPASSPEPGQYRVSRTPYVEEIQDVLSPQHPVREIYWMKGSQIGATTVGENWIGYCMDNSPGPIMAVEPGEDLLKRLVNHRINPMIRSVPTLEAKIQGQHGRRGRDSINEKSFPGGFLCMATANSSAQFRQTSIRYALADEIDGWPRDVMGEGDPYKLLLRRTANYSRSYKVLVASTPTIQDLSRIEELFLSGDMRFFLVPCPHCGTFQIITWRGQLPFKLKRDIPMGKITWKQTKGGRHKPDTAYMECAECNKKIDEDKHKTWMLENGMWEPTQESENPLARSYHLSALYSPVGWYSWARAAREFLEAKREGHNSIKAWTNTVLGETVADEGEGREAAPLLKHRIKYDGEVPTPAYLLTAGVDVQANRLELEVVAWNEAGTSYSIDYRVLLGSPKEDDVWEELESVLGHEWEHASGVKLRIAGMMIDSGFASESVWEFARLHESKNVHCGIGRAGSGRPAVSSPMRRKQGKSRRPVQVFIMGVDGMKGDFYDRLDRKLGADGSCHFPMRVPPYDLTYFKMLTAERLKLTRRRGFPTKEWHLIQGRRNEALDCRVYATAALHLLNPLWATVKKRFEKRGRDYERQKRDGTSAAPPPKRKAVRRKKLVSLR